MIHFGDILKRIRDEKEYTNEQFAAAYGVNRSTMANWLANVNDPPIEFLYHLSLDTGISMDNLIQGKYIIESQDLPTSLSATERRCLSYIRRMNPAGQELAETLMADLSENSTLQK